MELKNIKQGLLCFKEKHFKFLSFCSELMTLGRYCNVETRICPRMPLRYDVQ